jgi:3D (Asp-Asp-Asp) domain-containing protein
MSVLYVLSALVLVSLQATATVQIMDGDPFGSSSDFVGPAVLKSSIYVLPTEKDKPAYIRCLVKKTINDERGNLIAKTCPSFFQALVMEGSGLVENQGKWLLVNYAGVKHGRYMFTNVDRSKCPYGLGRRNLCLQPFISIAADFTKYRIGDVIYIPAVAAKRIKLPNGDIHRGYFIVTDTGSAIKGLGRFDIFIGPNQIFNSQNPFDELELGSGAKKYPYYRIERGSKTEREVQRYYQGKILDDAIDL